MLTRGAVFARVLMTWMGLFFAVCPLAHKNAALNTRNCVEDQLLTRVKQNQKKYVFFAKRVSWMFFGGFSANLCVVLLEFV